MERCRRSNSRRILQRAVRDISSDALCHQRTRMHFYNAPRHMWPRSPPEPRRGIGWNGLPQRTCGRARTLPVRPIGIDCCSKARPRSRLVQPLASDRLWGADCGNRRLYPADGLRASVHRSGGRPPACYRALASPSPDGFRREGDPRWLPARPRQGLRSGFAKAGHVLCSAYVNVSRRDLSVHRPLVDCRVEAHPPRSLQAFLPSLVLEDIVARSRQAADDPHGSPVRGRRPLPEPAPAVRWTRLSVPARECLARAARW